MKESLKIICFCILAACAYGIAHDMLTTHVCVEYFLPPVHPMIIPTTHPLLLALIWGIVATWWVGLFLGIPLAIVCRVGSKPKLSARDIVKPVLFMLAVLYVAAMLLGGIGYIMGQMELWLIPPYFHTVIAPERLAQFQFNGFAHEAAYWLGTIGGIVLMISCWRKRRAASSKRCVLRWVELFNKGDAVALAELYHDEAVNHQVANESVEGKANIHSMFEREFAA